MTDARGTKVLVGVPSKEFGRGRPCAMPRCKTTLSRYNPGDFCSAHEARFEPKLYETMEDMNVCRRCNTVKPATAGYFRRRDNGLNATCKVCEQNQERQRKERVKQLAAETAIEEAKRPKKRCSICGKYKPRTLDHFRASKESVDGLTRRCDECMPEVWRQASAKSRKKKAQAVAFESPNRMMSGEVRE